MGEPALGEPDPLHRRVLSSTVAAYGIQGARLLVGFVSKLVLARLILQESTGLYEEALRIVTVLAAVRDLGLPYQLMRDRDRPYGTVLWFTSASGALLAGGLALAAPLFGALQPDLPALLRVMAIWIVLDGLSVVPRVFFERELRIGRLVGPEVARIVAGAILSVGLALAGAGIWAFVWGELGAAALAALWAWRAAAGRFPLRAEPALLPGLLRRSSGLFLIWLVIQLVTYIDVFVIEWFGATAAVGAYARAYWIVFLVSALAWPRALLPALVAYVDDRARLFESFRLGTVQLLGFQVLASYFLFTNAEKVVEIILGPQWADAAPLVRVLAFVPFLDQFALLGGELFKARHEDGWWLAVMTFNLVSLVAWGAWFTARHGAVGMAAANYLLAGHLLLGWRLYRVFGRDVWRLGGNLLLLYLVPLPCFAATLLLPAAGWGRFAAGLMAAALAAAALAWKFAGGFRRYFRGD